MVQNLRSQFDVVAEEGPRIVLAQIRGMLESQPDLARHTLWLLTSGAITLDRRTIEAIDPDALPQICTKWRQLSVGAIRELLSRLEPSLSELWGKMKQTHLVQVVAFALHIDANSALYSQNKADLFQRAYVRYTAKGQRLQNFMSCVDINSQLKEDVAAYFDFQVPAGEAVKKVVSKCGQEVELPANLQDQDWVVDCAFSFTRARVKTGMVAIRFVDLFTNAGVQLEVPELIATNTGNNGMATPVSSSRGASSAGSPAS